jgi:hypothetical protein
VNPVLLMPADGCRFRVGDRCLYEELINPGLRREFVCTVLAALEGSFDEFVARGEIMGLSSEKAGLIWQERMAKALNIGWDCATFTPLRDEAGEVWCRHFFDGICLLGMPPCLGRCRHFELSDETAGEQGDLYD